MTIFKQILYYFSVYKKYIGSRLYIVFVLAGLAAMMEGFGISLLLPLLDAADVSISEGASQETNGVIDGLKILLDYLGIGSSMVQILLFIALVFLIKGLITFASNAYQSHLKAQLMYEIKSMVFDLYNRMNYSYYSSYNTGYFINIINPQVGRLVASFDSFKHFLVTIVTALVYLITASFLAWKFALMAFVSGLILLILFKTLNSYVLNLSRAAAHEQGSLNKFLVQSIQSFKYLVSTAQFDFLTSGVKESILKLSKYMRKQGIAQSLTTALTEPISIIFILIVIIFQVSFLDAPLAPIFVALILFNRAMGSILGIQSAWQLTMSKIGSLEIVESEVKRLLDNCEANGNQQADEFSNELEFRNVSFSYGEEHRDALQKISLKISANSTVAFVGESGAGKSTLVDMLTLLLKPQQGDLLIDKISFSELDLESWRKQIGYVSQESVIFDDTVANNICLWKGDYNNDNLFKKRIENAAKEAYAFDFIMDLPKQFNTIVGDRGVRLSGGQRQRLFLARELFKQPKLLILDEATSALDSASERYIQDSIEALKGSTTVVLIAHRLSTIKNADIIYVLKQGEIIEHGNYEKLINSTKSAFSNMVRLQKL